MKKISTALWLYLMTACFTVGSVLAEDWPSYQHDNRRSAATAEKLEFPMKQIWVYQSPAPLQTAWADSAPWDSFARKVPLKTMRRFDPALFVTVAGNRVFFGSSVDDSVHCLDASTGNEIWSYLTEGAVRLPPSYYKGKLYFGSDDGCAYCIDAKDARLVWKYRACEDQRLIPSNGKLISPWPVRTGVLVQDDKAYFAASLLPWRKSYLCALDADTGSDMGEGNYSVAHEGLTMQGSLLGSTRNLYVPQGRVPPVGFSIADGKSSGRFGGSRQAGVYALLTHDDHLIHGTGIYKGGLTESKSDTTDQIASFNGGNHMIVTADRSYFHTDTDLFALDRGRYLKLVTRRNILSAQQGEINKKLKELNKNKGENKDKIEELENTLTNISTEITQINEGIKTCYLWQIPCKYPYSLILADNVLIAGGENELACFDTAAGELIWTAKAEGKVHGLAAANAMLLASTEKGMIHCFAGSRQR
jgi:outer membrane protein assembly factor BamB